MATKEEEETQALFQSVKEKYPDAVIPTSEVPSFRERFQGTGSVSGPAPGTGSERPADEPGVFRSGTGRTSGVEFPGGRTFLGLSPDDVATLLGQREKITATPEGAVEISGTAKHEERAALANQLNPLDPEQVLERTNLAKSAFGIDFNTQQTLEAAGLGALTAATLASPIPGDELLALGLSASRLRAGAAIGKVGASSGLLGTAGTVAAGLFSVNKIIGKPKAEINQNKQVLTTSEEAFTKITSALSDYYRTGGKSGMSPEEAIAAFQWLEIQVLEAERNIKIITGNNVTSWLTDGGQDATAQAFRTKFVMETQRKQMQGMMRQGGLL